MDQDFLIIKLSNFRDIKEITDQKIPKIHRHIIQKFIIQIRMSFCQKHRNHHCIHSHSCTDKQHRVECRKSCKKQKKQQIPSILCRNSGPLKKITQRAYENSECSFKSSSPHRHNGKCTNCQNLNRSLEIKIKNIEELGKSKVQIQGKYRKLLDQNRQLSGVVDYYRSEMDRIVKCSQQDMKNQIKKNMKQNTEMVAKNKFLLAKLHELQQHIQTLTETLQQTQLHLSQAQQKNQHLSVSYSALYEKAKKLHGSESKSKLESQSLQKQNKNKSEHYKILIQESSHQTTKIQKQNKKLFSQNKDIKSQLQIVKSKLVNLQKLNKMDLDMSKERETVLKLRVEEMGKQIKQLKEKNIGLQKTLKLKEQQLQFSKKVIQKQLKSMKQKKELVDHIQQNKKETQIKPLAQPPAVQEDNMLTRSRVKENRPDFFNETATNEHQIQIKKLKQRIIILQNQLKTAPSSQAIQQYILTIGASEAFRRIIEEKNVYIKKLIREKGSLLQALP